MLNALKCLYKLPCKKAVSRALANPQGLRYCPELLPKTLSSGGRTIGKTVSTAGRKTVSAVSKTVTTPIQNSRVAAKGAKAAAETSNGSIEKTLRNVTQNSRYTKEETELAISMLESESPELVKALKASGDLYTISEITTMQDLVGHYPLSDIIRYRGNIATLANVGKPLNDFTFGKFRKYTDDYVNACEKFKAQDPFVLEEQIRTINQGIGQYGTVSPQRILFRGELSESQISRISSCYEAQQATGQKVVYHPNHLVSTSLSKDAVSGKGNYAGKCLLEIEVPESTKILDVNGLLGARNKFDWQKEFLLPSDVGFEVLSRRVNGDRLLFRLRLLEQ